MAAIQNAIAAGAVPSHVSNVCPEGTKVYLLEVGWLEGDEAWVVTGGNGSLKSTEGQVFANKRRELPMYCVLIDHPLEDLILWETGCGMNYPETPGGMDVFVRVRYEPKHDLTAAIAATGNKIEDVKKMQVLMALLRNLADYLQVSLAICIWTMLPVSRTDASLGGLDRFIGRKDVEIWVHDVELRSAFWSVATGADDGVYLKDYLDLSLNWKTFDERTIDFCQGITLHHLPGHTEGLVGMQLNLLNSGTFFFISDHCHVIENWRDGIPQGWLVRNHPAWFQSTQRLKRLQSTTKGRVIPGHDKETFLQLQSEIKEYLS
ncbi:hypothetical protein HYFRA_00003071 [Hymenoscyphus fraxineus]|uniref:Metallo-beta-lactamase domain-containing protein n=1 Tax=Hymenoscyphus fraxineus TaxID=746836 RepID=A0A9N9PFU1_9HELO|nr:hypothetical protein HYFRA_00003071 [Hymenoscyphus fraxineus]